MKINKITNAQEFFKVVDDCKGRVELLTGEGDRLNLKSKLCQFMSMTQLFSRADELHLEIVASEEEDLQKICKYLMKPGSYAVEVSGSGFYLSPCIRKKLPVAGSVDFVFRVFNGRGCIEKSFQYTLFHFRKKSVSY